MPALTTETLTDTVARLRGLSPWSVARAAGWKARSRALTLLERLGGYQRLARHGETWSASWQTDYGSRGGVASWLARPAAGRWWLPSPAHEWAAKTCTADDLALADSIANGTLDLLGSGPVAIGNPPRWRLDLYTGHEWPLDEASRVALVRNDGSDLRTVCEFSRCYHFLTLARAYWATREERYLTTFAQHVTSWRAQNPIGYGPLWSPLSAMELALRLSNWALAVPLFAEARLPQEFWRTLLADLVSGGLFLERHPEWHPRFRGSHYVGAGVGLVYAGALFRGTAFGDRWLAKGADILTREIVRQIHRDGVSFEGALAYHRHHTELFAFGGLMIRRNLPSLDMSRYEARVRRMYAFIDSYSPTNGDAPMLGDADDSRLHALDARSLRQPRQHRLGLPDDRAPNKAAQSRAFPLGGFYVIRGGDDHAVVRCGAVGLAGAGSHDHNDQLSFELVASGRRVVADSGAYAYTRDLALRHKFRGTAAHSVIQIDGEEQNPIRASMPWRILEDRTRSTCDVWRESGPVPRFHGRHRGYEHLGATCRRELSFHAARHAWRLVDRVEGAGEHDVVWRLHLAPGTLGVRENRDGEAIVTLDGQPAISVVIRYPTSLRAAVLESPMSNRYGSMESRPLIEVSGRIRLPVRIACVIRPRDLERAFDRSF